MTPPPNRAVPFDSSDLTQIENIKTYRLYTGRSGNVPLPGQTVKMRAACGKEKASVSGLPYLLTSSARTPDSLAFYVVLLTDT